MTANNPEAVVSGRGTADVSSAPSAGGLASPGYMSERGKEECYRAHRYRRPLALLVVGLAEPDPPTELRLQAWLRSETRLSDLAAHLGGATYGLLLPESDGKAAAGLGSRIQVAFPLIKTGIGAFPEDGNTWEEMLGAACSAAGLSTDA